LWIPDSEILYIQIIQQIYNSITTGYPGQNTIFAILLRKWFWPKLVYNIKRFIQNCTVCGKTIIWQNTKYGLLKPLPILQQIWTEISMDFITSLPIAKESSETNCLVITDRFTKNIIFIGIDSIISDTVAKIFLYYFYIYHGLPKTIVNNCGLQFVNKFWRIVCKKLQIQRQLSTVFHPQTDGSTEYINQEIEQILYIFIYYIQNNWIDLLSVITIAINNCNTRLTEINPFFLYIAII
jgi:hypothetical protein